MPPKRNVPWTEDELEQLPLVVKAVVEEDGRADWVAIADRLGGRHTPDATRIFYRAAGHPPVADMVGPSRMILKARYTQASEDSPASAWDDAKTRTGRDLDKHANRRFLDIAIDSQLPIGITVVSDQHIRTSGPVDLARMESDALLVRDTDGMFGVLGGDGIDNHIKHHAAMVHGGTSVAEEWRLFEHYLGFFGDKILTVISGNHDDWTVDFSGYNALERIVKDKKVFFAPDEAVLTVKVGDEPYVIKVRHQYRFKSYMNLIHTVKRLWEVGEDDFDIGVVCHEHEAGCEPFMRHGKQVWGARPGSYQFTSGHGRRYGYNAQRPRCPTFILFPDQHEVMGFVDVRQGAGFLKWLRSDWPNSYRAIA
jgi:hypothetical protein